MELARLLRPLRRARGPLAFAHPVSPLPSSPRAPRAPFGGAAPGALRPAGAAPTLAEGARRALDVAAASAGLLLLSPLLLSIAAMVRATEGGGPALYGHARIGRDGRVFRCWKFRTMVVDGDAVLARALAADPLARAEWDATRKLRVDPRVTRLGRVMRRLSIDELPQLINVLRGDMSLVGPRPVVADELDRYGRSATYYLRVRPGLTGLWQISGRSDTSYRRRVAFDRYYVTHRTLRGDIAILVRTVPVVCFAQGSY